MPEHCRTPKRHELEAHLALHRKHPAGKSEHWAIALYDLRHQIKMRYDTPSDLRSTLPPPSAILQRWVMRVLDRMPTKHGRLAEREAL